MNDYEEKFNSLKSGVKADISWKRYFNPTEKRRSMRDRYDYSMSKLCGNVLDVGCSDGFGIYLMSLNPKITHITGIEIHDKALTEARKNLKGIKNIKLVKGIGEEMPFEGFDSIHCGHTLEHVFDDEAVLREIRRLLRGTAVISVPINGGISLQHVREYTTAGFVSLVDKYFEIIDMKAFVAHNTSLVVICR